jgi:hypothetical protein
MNWFREYKMSLKMAEVEEFVDVFIYRPIAFLLVLAIRNTRIKPDHLTLTAMLMGIIAGFFFATGTKSGAITGALFFLLFNIFDCSDGQLARIKKNGSSVGRILDGIADYTATIMVFAGIAVGFSGKPDQPHYLVQLLIIAGISVFVQESLVDYYRTRFLDIVLQRKDTFHDEMDEYRREFSDLKKHEGKWFDKFVIGIYLIYSTVQRKLIARKKRLPDNLNPQDFYRKNKLIIRFWVFIGPSATITAMILCSIFTRFDIFFMIVSGIFNALALSLWIIQFSIDKTFNNH